MNEHYLLQLTINFLFIKIHFKLIISLLSIVILAQAMKALY